MRHCNVSTGIVKQGSVYLDKWHIYVSNNKMLSLSRLQTQL